MLKEERFLKKYQKLLRLQDWDLKFEWLPDTSTDRMGETEIFPGISQATIRVRKGMSDSEHSRTLIHELIHVRLGDQDIHRGSYQDNAFEVGIEMIGRAILGD